MNTVSWFDVASNRSSYMLEYIKKRRDKWISENGPCKNCGNTENLEVDHIDPTTKEIEVKHVWTRKESDRIRELSKCQVLCIDCHHEKTTKENTRWKHGTLSGYQRYHCRCVECKTFYQSYRRNRYIKTGQ